MTLWTRLADMVYPPQCIACPAETDLPDGLCAACWREVQFITGPVCRYCAHPVEADGLPCTDCHREAPAWDAGHAAVLYDGIGRRIVLSLKHGDRTDLAPAAARWMARAAAPSLGAVDLIAPVPLHWSRLIHRRFNQSAELARALGALTDLPVAPDLLTRRHRTRLPRGLDRDARRGVLDRAIVATPRRAALITGRHILLIDDVLTSGATLNAATRAFGAAGARRVTILVLARVARSEVPLGATAPSHVAPQEPASI